MKVTLITGATSGIGEALAYQFAEKKQNLLLVARNEQKLQHLCHVLADKHKIGTDYIVADLSKPDTPNFIYQESKKKNVFVDILVNNAGVGSSGEFVKNNLQSELEILQINNASMVALCHLFLPDMVSNKNGSIINVGSMASFFPSPYMSVYAASKMFVLSFTQALTEECRPYSVKVMLFCPGLTTSNFMNTPANNNEWGKVLTAGAKTQTPKQVATEMIYALEKKKAFHVSGRMNALSAKVVALIPNTTIAKQFAKSKRKQMGI
ncbi:SDR family NAD(P)-dependent oxidoreductase [bacterium]|nr:SDR family NAD(P)-dependent oxidoreductase [bacterium]